MERLIVVMSFVVIAMMIGLSEQMPRRPQETGSLSKRSCKDACKQKPMDIAFVVDGSSSVWPENFTLALWFVEDFLEIFHIADDEVRVAAVSYGDRVYKEDAFGFSSHSEKNSLIDTVVNIPYRAGLSTETGDAIKYMKETLMHDAREGVPHVCIVLTDGNSQRPDYTSKQAKEAREAGIDMFSVGVGHDVSPQELRNIAGEDDHFFRVDNYELLNTIKTRLAFEACGEKPVPEVVCRDNPMDISFVIDASASIGSGNFTIGQEFIKGFVQTFHIGSRATRISAVTYGRGVYKQDAFNFDSYDDETDVVDAMLALPYRAGDYTSTGDGIKYMREHQMTKNRTNAAHICIVLTDGRSQEWEITYAEAAEARKQGINMFAVGVGEVGVQLSRKELKEIAGRDDHVFTVADYKTLDTIKQGLDDKTCSVVLTKFRHPF